MWLSEWTRRNIKEHVFAIKEDDKRTVRVADRTQIYAPWRRRHQHFYIHGLTPWVGIDAIIRIKSVFYN